MEKILAFFGLDWTSAISFGMLLVDLGKRAAIKEGVDPEKLAAYEAARQARLAHDCDKLIGDLEAIVKP